MTVSVIRGTTTHVLNEADAGRLLAHDGWGMAPLHRLVERGPLQYGETDRGFRLDPRIGTLVVGVKGSSIDDLYTQRAALINVFAPAGDDPLIVRWTRDDGTQRQIECHFVDALSLPFDARQGYWLRASVRLRCPDPTFYDPTGKASTFELGGGGDSLEIPLEVPMVVGTSTLDATNTITYGGNWRSYPHLIRITGPITDAVITNETTGEALDFTGTTIGAGDYYDIDLRYGQKTVEDSSGTNKIADLTDDSDLATWHLAPAPEASGGENSINVTGTSITEATSVAVNFFERYLGL